MKISVHQLVEIQAVIQLASLLERSQERFRWPRRNQMKSLLGTGKCDIEHIQIIHSLHEIFLTVLLCKQGFVRFTGKIDLIGPFPDKIHLSSLFHALEIRNAPAVRILEQSHFFRIREDDIFEFQTF